MKVRFVDSYSRRMLEGVAAAVIVIAVGPYLQMNRGARRACWSAVVVVIDSLLFVVWNKCVCLQRRNVIT
jgi:hypothetical protein